MLPLTEIEPAIPSAGTHH